MNKKRNLTIEEQIARMKKRYLAVLAVLGLVIILLGCFIYLNYDYIAFKHFITSFYFDTEALDELYKSRLGRDVDGRYYKYFDDLAISLITKGIREIKNDRYTYLYTPESYRKYLNEEKEEAEQSEIKVLTDKTAMLKLTNFSKYTGKFVKDNQALLKKYPNLIIDLRDNYGGDIDVMAFISDLFLPKGSIIATDKLRMLNWVYKAKRPKMMDFEKIYILQNKNSASASENFISALKDNLSNVNLIGENTYGKGIGQYTLQIKRGFAVKATILSWYTPKGINIHNKGIEPDIRYDKEDIVQYALDMIEG